MSFYEEIVTAFNKHGVRFIVFGGFAVNFYGYGRYTADLGLWIDPNPSNYQNLETHCYQWDLMRKVLLRISSKGKSIMLRIAEEMYKSTFSKKSICGNPLWIVLKMLYFQIAFFGKFTFSVMRIL